MGSIFYFIKFPESMKIVPKYPSPIQMKTETLIFWLSYTQFTVFICSSKTLMLSCALARYLWLKLANINVIESMLMYKLKSRSVLASCTVLVKNTLTKVYISPSLGTGSRSGHISFRAESAFLKIPLRSLNTLSAARSTQNAFGNLLVRESVE